MTSAFVQPAILAPTPSRSHSPSSHTANSFIASRNFKLPSSQHPNINRAVIPTHIAKAISTVEQQQQQQDNSNNNNNNSNNSASNNIEKLDVGFPPHGEYLYDDPNGLTFTQRLEHLVETNQISKASSSQLYGWYTSYKVACENNPDFTSFASRHAEQMFSSLLELCRKCNESSIEFQSIHSQLRQPIDYYMFGFQFALPLIDKVKSTLLGEKNVKQAEQQLKDGHNVIFLSNHQSEGDPYAFDFLLRFVGKVDPQICKDIYFMAGDRVREDPVVMPFSAGRNLLTVYSKKHMNDQPELREMKINHNKRTLSETIEKFKKGGCLIWMAPSGGRDRRNSPNGHVEVSPFDDASIDMMKLTALKSQAPCHFYPMALWSYDMLPPPTTVGGSDLGEERYANFIPMHLFVGDEIQWDNIVSKDIVNKSERRKAQRDYIQSVVEKGYEEMGGYSY